MTYSTCDFLPDLYVNPAVKTDQPKGCSQNQIDAIPDIEKIEMGYRFRLPPDTNCHRLAPKYENNGIWYPPTQRQTDFLRMFCIALREYGAIPSDGSGGYRGMSYQGENDITANWTEVFGSDIDESTQSWSYLIRDTTTPDDNRYRDERYGIPWHKLQVLDVSDVGDVNQCCLDSNQCATTPAPTYTPYIDTTPGPTCLNENCCFKNRAMNYTLRINDDNCVIYNCTFKGSGIKSSDIISVYTKRDGTPAYNTLIAFNMFYFNDNQDGIDLKGASNTQIYNNWFGSTVSNNYAPIRLQQAVDTYITNNTITGSVDISAIMFKGDALDAIMNTYIIGNTISDVDYGVRLDQATNTQIIDNVFTNLTATGVRWEYYDTETNTSNGVTIQNNVFTNVARGIYVGYDIGLVNIDSNIITNTTRSSNAHGIEFSGFTDGAIIQNNLIYDIKHNCINVIAGNVNMQILNNIMHDCYDSNGINTNGDNYMIKGNQIYNIEQFGTGGRGIYPKSYGTMSGNLIFNVSRRGISTSSDYAHIANNEIIIENNIIHDIKEDSIYIYGSVSPSALIVRFNTVVNTQSGKYALYIPTGITSTDIYCNIFVTADVDDMYQDRTTNNVYNNLNSIIADVSNIQFINYNEDNLHIQTTSPAIGYCNNLDLNTLPLPSVDYDNKIRKTDVDIDAGADQRSPIVPTASPTEEPTETPTSPTKSPSMTPTSDTGSPTAAPVDVDTPTASPVIPDTTEMLSYTTIGSDSDTTIDFNMDTTEEDVHVPDSDNVDLHFNIMMLFYSFCILIAYL